MVAGEAGRTVPAFMASILVEADAAVRPGRLALLHLCTGQLVPALAPSDRIAVVAGQLPAPDAGRQRRRPGSRGPPFLPPDPAAPVAGVAGVPIKARVRWRSLAVTASGLTTTTGPTW